MEIIWKFRKKADNSDKSYLDKDCMLRKRKLLRFQRNSVNQVLIRSLFSVRHIFLFTSLLVIFEE